MENQKDYQQKGSLMGNRTGYITGYLMKPKTHQNKILSWNGSQDDGVELWIQVRISLLSRTIFVIVIIKCFSESACFLL